MPKLKVPSTVKPAKKQLTLLQLERRPLHSPGQERSPQAASMDKPVDHHQLAPGRLPPSLSPKKQNGLKPISKSFADVFGESDDEVRRPT